MHLQKRFLIVAALALLPVNRCLAQFFTPVSTTIDAGTGYTVSGTNGQGSGDDQDFGNQTGTLQASAEFNYDSVDGVLVSNATGTVTVDPAAGMIDVNLSATGEGQSTFTSLGFLAATAGVSTTIIFDVPPNSGMYVSLNLTAGAITNFTSSLLTDPDGFSTGASGVNFPSVPAGQYTLECGTGTSEVTGLLWGGSNSDRIQFFPEPEVSALLIAAMTLFPLRRRRG